MATTPTFYSRGLENGLPYCPDEVDVTNFHDWITLGGTRKGDAKSGTLFEFQKARSLDHAASLVWMGDFLEAEAIQNNQAGQINTLPFASEANERICLGPSDALDRVSTKTYDPGSTSDARDQNSMYIRILRMMDDGDFVGYGLAEPPESTSRTTLDGVTVTAPMYSFTEVLFDLGLDFGPFGTFALVELWSFFKSSPLSDNNDLPIRRVKHTSVEIGGIHYFLHLFFLSDSSIDDFGMSVANRRILYSLIGSGASTAEVTGPAFLNPNRILK